MSLQTWIDEFYPVAAEDVVGAADLDVALVEHALKKWRGLTKKHLDKHKLRAHRDYITPRRGSGYFPIDTSTCALCVVHRNASLVRCATCPLAEQLDRPCDAQPDDADELSPYDAWCNDADPQPMITALELTLVRLTNGETPTT